MSFLSSIKNRIEILFTSVPLFLSFVFGILISWIFKNNLTLVFLRGKSFSGRSLFYQLGIFSFYTLIFTILLFVLFFIIQKILSKKPQKVIKKLNNLYNNSKQDDEQRIFTALLVLGVGFACVFLINNILSTINITNWSYVKPEVVPGMSPVGFDFRIGSYETAFNLVESNYKQIRADGSYSSIYPPFVAITNIPYLLFSENTAYLWHIGLLFLANFVCMALVSLMVKEFILSNLGWEKTYITAIVIFLFFTLLIYTSSSYSFIFSVERGNTDIFAILFALLAVWSLLKKPDSIWLQVILLSVATHLKIYPAVLFLLLLMKHGKKLILPAVTLNLFFLFILGPKMALSFLQTLTSGSGVGAGIGNKWTWVGNHSAYSFADTLALGSANYSSNLYVLWGIFTLIPILLWGIASIKLINKEYSPQKAILFLMVSILLMDLIPTVSMDYKLVILSPAALLLIAYIIKQTMLKPGLLGYFQLAVVITILLFIGRPYTMSEFDPYGLKSSASYFINNKYLWSLALEFVIVWNIFSVYNPKNFIKPK